MIHILDNATLSEMKSFPDLATMLNAFKGQRSARELAELCGIDQNATVRGLRGEPIPDKAADRLIKFFKMDLRQEEEFRSHVRRARALAHKAAREYINEIESELDQIEMMLLRFARSVTQNGQIDAEKVREFARSAMEFFEGPSRL